MENTERLQFKTRNNTNVVIDEITPEGIFGSYHSGGYWQEVVWDVDGSFRTDGQEHPLDLVMENTVIHDVVGHG